MLPNRIASCGAKRSLHVSTSNKDFMSWFKKKQTAKPSVPIKKTEEVINEVESGARGAEVPLSRLKLTEDFFIGKNASDLDRRERQSRINEIPFNVWRSSEKLNSSDALDNILIESYNSTHSRSQVTGIADEKLALPFTDLAFKFHFSKAIQSATGTLITDYQITRLQTPIAFRDYLLKEVVSGKLAKFKDSEPNAIELAKGNYSSDSIHVVEDVRPHERKKRLSKILSEVEALEREAARQAVEEARQAA
ncbi:LAQU0S01e10308g1_1 [Lachancea quebecensis]|uniref:Large ribosomal subunit protein mL50 n=1 Tax=Lachancea quebecensis TaxID=1654605 RepID=A0A0P1KPR2_9SACH|nr:LAQU0S01e10308g1_1 [Lachancea quebecensis]